MSVPTKEYPTRGRDDTVPPDGTRTYARLWPMQYLSGFVIAIATLGITIRANAFAAFYNGTAIMLALAFSLTFFAFTPSAILAGRLVGRWGPRKTLLASNYGYLALMAIALVALAADYFPPWLALALLLGRTGSQSVQITALESSVPVLFSKRDLIRANGSRMILTASVAGFEAPIAEAIFPAVIGLFVLIALTSVVLIASLVGVLRADIPDTLPLPVDPPVAAEPANYAPLRAYLRRRPGLIVVLASFALFNFAFGFSEVSDRQITAGLGSDATTNVVLGVGFVFMLATTIAITLRGTPRGHVRWLRTLFLALGLAMVLGSARPNMALVTTAVVVFLVSAPIIMAIVSTLLHANTTPHLMGRMMGVKTMIIGLFYGLGNVIAALFVTTPERLAGGSRVHGGALGALVGDGDAYGRVYALLTMILGVVVVALVLAFGRHRSLQDLDDPNADEHALETAPAPRRAVRDASPVGDLAANPAAAG